MHSHSPQQHANMYVNLMLLSIFRFSAYLLLIKSWFVCGHCIILSKVHTEGMSLLGALYC